MTEIQSFVPQKAALEQQWKEHAKAVEQNQPSPLKPITWLEGFYDYFYQGENHYDKIVATIAADVLQIVDTDGGDYIQTKIDQTREHLLDDTNQSTPKNLLKKIPVQIGKSLQRLQHQKKFEDLLTILKHQETTPTPFEQTDITGVGEDQKAKQRLEKLGEQEEALSPKQQEIVEAVASISVTKEDLEANIIESEIAKGGETKEVAQKLQTIRDHLQAAFQGSTREEVLDQLATHQAFFQQYIPGFKLRFFDRLPQLKRTTLRQWQQEKATLQSHTNDLLSDNSIRETLISDLLKRKVVNDEEYLKLDAMKGIVTCYFRVLQLEQYASPDLTDPQQKKIAYAASLSDLINEDVSPTFIEDIVNGKMTSNDIASYAFLQFVMAEIPELTQVQDMPPNERLEKLKELLEQGKNVLAAPLVAMMLAGELLAKLPIPKPSFLQGGGGGGANLELGNPFEGMNLIGNKKLWSIATMPTNPEGTYYRLQSSSLFDVVNSKWLEDSVMREQNILLHNYSQRAPEFIYNAPPKMEGKRQKPKNGVWHIPAPYGYIPARITFGSQEGQISSTYDGSFCLDYNNLDYNRFPKKTLVNFIEGEGLFGMDSVLSLDDIIASPDTLPQDVQDFLKNLDQEPLSKQEEAWKIINFVKDTFTYSLDPKNKKIYDDARKKGSDEFVKTIYSCKKVKCDGAATAAIGLLRLRGIRARLVTGFFVEAGSEQITTGDAHGWVEYLNEKGEIFYGDPTPTKQDEVTKKILNRSNFINSVMEKMRFGKNRWTIEEFDSLRQSISKDMASIFQRIVPSHEYHYSPKDLDYPTEGKRKRERKNALKEKMNGIRKKLSAIRTDFERNPTLTTNQLIVKLDKEGIISEKDLRKQMVERNFEEMVEVATTTFYDNLFHGKLPFDDAFQKKYMSTHHGNQLMQQFQMHSRSTTRELSRQFSRMDTRNLVIRDEHGEHSDVFLDTVTSIVRGSAFEQLTGIGGQDRKDRELRAAIAEQIKKHSSMVTKETVKQSYIPELCESFIGALQILEAA